MPRPVSFTIFVISRIAIALVASAAIGACASLPKVAGSDDALVVGRFTLTCSSNYANTSQEHDRSSFTFTDLTINRRFTVNSVDKGFFFFAAAPEHKYQLESISADYYDNKFQLHDEVDVKECVAPTARQRITYLGHIRYAETINYDDVNNKRYVGAYFLAANNYYDVVEFLSSRQNGEEWLSYPILSFDGSRATYNFNYDNSTRKRR